MAFGIARRAPYGVRLPYLRAWREYRLMTQGMLEEATQHAGAKVSRYTITRIEDGKVTRIETVKRLAAALDVTPEQLCREAPAQTAAV